MRRLCCLSVLLALGGCFDPEDPPESTGGDDGSTSSTGGMETGPTTDPSGPTTDPSGTTTATTAPTSATASSTGDDSDTDDSDTDDESSSSSTGDPVVLECGDGIVAPGEVCFDDASVYNSGDIGYSPRVGEVNGDGNVDLLYMYGDQIVVRLGDGTGMFGPEIPDETIFCHEMELADVDGDDLLDHICVSDYDTPLSVSLGNGSGSFALQTNSVTLPTNAQQMAAGDLNGDGNADVVTVHGPGDGFSGAARVLLSQGNGEFVVGDSLSTSNLPAADTALGDFTGDGVPDIALTVAEGSDQLRIAINDGSGDFGAPLIVNVTTNGTQGVAAGDFNNDEDDDIALANGGNVLAMLGTGTASFEAPEVLPVPDGAVANLVTVADINSDELADVIAVYSNQAMVSVFPSNGDGTFDDRIDIMVGAASDSLATGDVNDDGVPDIVLGSTSTELITVLISTP